ncbi:glycosyltransferase [Paracoccus caeni]|uniref:Glycosyltransferase n=1 Tax=Paracoccus caeni TaxID=657651 RepID=A0A934VWK2_9RHOB|nr:glycosyltransferase [Paracoccus caeni]MBK4218146.1 glycosyltransferase [Paracoccus caeni]
MNPTAMELHNLLVIAPAPGRADGDSLILDKKFVEGMRFYANAWPGRTTCLLQEPRREGPFLGRFDPAALPFAVSLRPTGHHVTAADLDGHDVILCSGDNQEYLHVARLCRQAGKAIYFSIENIPETRRKIVLLDPGRSLPSRLRALWNIGRAERQRLCAFALADGLQANGYPAADLYRPVNGNTVLYLDNRIDGALLATPEEMAARRSHLLDGGRLRLIHSGRLEPLKGSQDLIPIARRLRDGGVDFSLDIFGDGTLDGAIRQGIADHGLSQHVRLHGSVDFATELVPYARQNSDLFLSCHRQSDPSCSYLENMGCGLAVMGYGNRMWTALAADSKAGWVAPMDDWQALADRLIALAADRRDLADACERAWSFAGAHLFETEFDKRIAQMKKGG